MTWNSIGGGLTALLCLTGLVVWWPGVANWRRNLGMRRGVGWKRMNWDLHSAVGIWSFALVFMWGTTGFYFVYPQPFRAAIEVFTPINPPRLQSASPTPPSFSTGTGPRRRRRPLTLGGKILRDFSSLHYGNFGGWPLKTLYVLLGFAPRGAAGISPNNVVESRAVARPQTCHFVAALRNKLLGIMACTPRVPSTSCVISRSIATLVST